MRKPHVATRFNYQLSNLNVYVDFCLFFLNDVDLVVKDLSLFVSFALDIVENILTGLFDAIDHSLEPDVDLQKRCNVLLSIMHCLSYLIYEHF